MTDGTPGYLARSRAVAVPILAAVVVLVLAPAVLGQTTTTNPTSMPAGLSPAERYGMGCLAPALVAISLAIIARQVIVSLTLGIFPASAMLCILHGQHNPLLFVTTMMDRFVLGVLMDREHLTILVYTFLLGAMIGVVNANGGTR